MVVLGGFKVVWQILSRHMHMAASAAEGAFHNHIGTLFKVFCSVLSLYCSPTSVGTADRMLLAVTKMGCSADEPIRAFLAAILARGPPIATAASDVHGQRSPVKRPAAVQRTFDHLVLASPVTNPFHMRQDVRQFADGSATRVSVRTLHSHLLDSPICHLVGEGLGLSLRAAVGALEVALANLLLLSDSTEARRTHYLTATPQLLRFVRNLATHEAPIPGWIFKEEEIIHFVRILEKCAIPVSHIVQSADTNKMAAQQAPSRNLKLAGENDAGMQHKTDTACYLRRVRTVYDSPGGVCMCVVIAVVVLLKL